MSEQDPSELAAYYGQSLQYSTTLIGFLGLFIEHLFQTPMSHFESVKRTRGKNNTFIINTVIFQGKTKHSSNAHIPCK